MSEQPAQSAAGGTHWSQAELAERLLVSRQAVNQIEPSLPLAFRIGRLFGLPVEEIFDDGERGSR